MAKKSYLVGFFIFLAILIMFIPIFILVAKHNWRKEQRKVAQDPESSPERAEPQSLSSPKTFGMLAIGNRGATNLRIPENAQIHETIPGRLNSTTKPSYSRPGRNIYAAAVSDVDDIPNTAAAAVAADGPDIGRSDTQKTYSSTASTIVDRQMRVQSIATASTSPLPTILPGSDGYFRAPFEGPSLDSRRTGSYRTVASDQSGVSSPKSRKLTEDYHLQRERSRSKGKGKARVDLQKVNENQFHEVDLGEPSINRKQGVQSKDFAPR